MSVVFLVQDILDNAFEEKQGTGKWQWKRWDRDRQTVDWI